MVPSDKQDPPCAGCLQCLALFLLLPRLFASTAGLILSPLLAQLLHEDSVLFFLHLAAGGSFRRTTELLLLQCLAAAFGLGFLLLPTHFGRFFRLLLPLAHLLVFGLSAGGLPAMAVWIMADLMARRLTGENTISWRDPTSQTKQRIPG